LFFNILHNAYPVLSLRLVRARADRLFGSSENGESSRRRRSRVVGETLTAQQAAAADERRMV
jgi:hypothetical protein